MKDSADDKLSVSTEDALSNWLGGHPVRPSGHEIYHVFDNIQGNYHAPAGTEEAQKPQEVEAERSR